jgi:hypothetical protein
MGLTQFVYAPPTDTFKPSVTEAECGYACHTTVAAQDYIYTAALLHRPARRQLRAESGHP